MSITADKISFSYGTHNVLKSVSFSAEYGEVLSVLGPNGTGKSTLFRCMLGLSEPSSGGTFIDGISISDMTERELAGKLAYIPQSHNPIFNFSVMDMVLMGTASQLGKFSAPGKKQKEIAENAIEEMGISHLKDRGYGNISGGERQLVIIARAIAQQAKILIMDEPSANLDFGNRIKLFETMKRLAKKGYAVIQSTHDPEQAYLYSDKILALYGGEVLKTGTPSEIITDSIISELYGTEIKAVDILDGKLRVCIPAKEL